MKTLGEVLGLSSQFLNDKKISRSRRIAEELLGFTLKLKRVDLYMQFDRPLLEEELEVFRSLLKRAAKGEPVPYITGEVLFYDCTLRVTPDVLIPRPETEILVDLACKQIQQQLFAGKVVWDLCTGSGCMGIAVKKACPDLKVTLSDLSAEALRIAAENAQRNQVEVETVQGDLLAPFASAKADFIFCNPPYVSPQEYEQLDPSVRDHEPKLALVAEEEGLGFYRRLKEELPVHLNPGAKIYLEIGSKQGKAVLELFSGAPWKAARVEKDWAGHDRFFFLEFE
jgi:release factor glutamine methyltransferase